MEKVHCMSLSSIHIDYKLTQSPTEKTLAARGELMLTRSRVCLSRCRATRLLNRRPRATNKLCGLAAYFPLSVD